MVVLIRSRLCLQILPISDLAGLIRRQVGLLAKLGLLSLRVMKASRKFHRTPPVPSNLKPKISPRDSI